MTNNRCRNYALITYHPEEVIKSVLTLYAGRIRHFAYILHDKDIYPDDEHDKKTGAVIHKKGDAVEPHHHLLLCMNNPITQTAIRNLFPQGQTTLAQPIRDKADCFVYLNHKDKPEKYQYPDGDIVCDDLSYWQNVQSGESDDRTLNILDDILAGVGFRELAKRYGRDLVINYSKYWSFAKAVQRTEGAELERLPKGMTVETVNPHQEGIFEGIDPETGEVLDAFAVKTPDPID